MSAIPVIMIAKTPLVPSPGFVATLDRTSVFDTDVQSVSGQVVRLQTVYVQCDVVGGSGDFEYKWVKVSGSDRISAGFGNEDQTFFLSDLNTPNTLTAVFECKVTDRVTRRFTISNRVTVTLTLKTPAIDPTNPGTPPVIDPPSTGYGPITAVVAAPTPVSASGKPPTGQSLKLTTGGCSVTVTGGSGNFDYKWAPVSSAESISINSPTSKSTSFSTTSAVALERNAGFRCTVTDRSSGQKVTSNVVFASFSFAAPDPVSPALQSVNVSKRNVSKTAFGGASAVTTATTEVVSASPVPANASGLRYSWRRVSGSSAIRPTSSSGPNTAFTISIQGGWVASYNAVFVCDVTDTINNVTKTGPTVSVAIHFEQALFN